MNSVIITGSEGYIGENLQHYLFNKGIYKVYCFDKKSGNNVEDLEILPEADVIIHLAAIPGIQNCEDNPTEAIINNVSASFNLLRLSYKQKIPIYFASSQAAKDPNSSLYAMTKFTVETEILRYNSLGMKNKILRFSNVYGGHKYLEKKTSVVANFINNHNNNKPLEIHGKGNQKRDFLHVNDLCEVIYDIYKHFNIKDEIIDIGTGQEKSIIEIAKTLSNNIKYLEGRNVGCESNFADISILENNCLYIPKIDKVFHYLKGFKKEK
jgi:UDP-glucose 4-epimerase